MRDEIDAILLEMEEMDRDVDQPDHYAKDVLQPVVFLLLNNVAFGVGSAIKYLMRGGKKKYDGLTLRESHIRDLKKARRYIDLQLRLIEIEEELHELADEMCRKLGLK